MALFRKSLVDLQIIDSVTWYHRFEVLPDVLTPGISPFSGDLLEPEVITKMISKTCEVDLLQTDGLRVLELGTWDGPLAYFLKSKGVDIHASDIQDPTKTGFNVLGEISGLKVPYTHSDVYRLHANYPPQSFDLIIYMGIFYHLKHPILAFENIASILKPGGKVYVSGTGLGRRFEGFDEELLDDQTSAEAFGILERLDELGVPLSLDYAGRFNKASNWIFPNRSALRNWMASAGLEVSRLHTSIKHTGAAAHRCCGTKTRALLYDHSLTGGGTYTSFEGT